MPAPPPGTVRALARLKLDRRRIHSQTRWGDMPKDVPQIRIANAHLRRAGFAPGDYILVTSPRVGILVIVRDPDQRPAGEQPASGAPSAPHPASALRKVRVKAEAPLAPIRRRATTVRGPAAF